MVKVWSGLCLLAIAASANAQTLNIVHEPVACAVVEKFPKLEARVLPQGSAAVARVFFQGATAEWYSVVMKAEGAALIGVLPKPKKELKTVRYYIETTDKALAVSRTAEYTMNVVASGSECKGKLVAGALGSASVLLQGPTGAAVLPAGFASSGVVAGSAAGSGSAVGAAGASAGGGGMSTGAVVGIGAGVAGAAAAAVVVAGGNSDAAGHWSGSVQTFRPGTPDCNIGSDMVLDLTQSGDTITGTQTNTTRTTSPSGCYNGVSLTGPLTGTIKGGAVTYTWVPSGGTSLSFSYTGTLEGNALRGTSSGTTNGVPSFTGTWSVSR